MLFPIIQRIGTPKSNQQVHSLSYKVRQILLTLPHFTRYLIMSGALSKDAWSRINFYIIRVNDQNVLE